MQKPMQPKESMQPMPSKDAMRPMQTNEAMSPMQTNEATSPMRTNEAMHSMPQREHEWLQQMVGEWSYEMEGPMEPGKPSQKIHGTEQMRSLDGMWVVSEMMEKMHDGQPGTTSMMALGYDPRKEKFVGTFLSSAMSHLWTYEGRLSEDGKMLVLEKEGPSMSGDGMMRYRDMIRMESEDKRTMVSEYFDGGSWKHLMTMNFRRMK